jgi:hypothetical protein
MWCLFLYGCMQKKKLLMNIVLLNRNVINFIRLVLRALHIANCIFDSELTKKKNTGGGIRLTVYQ